MPGLKEILFPVDFSPRCAQAAPAVQAWTRQFNANLTLLHALALPLNPPEAYPDRLYDEMRGALQAAGERAMRDFIRRNLDSVPLEHTIVEGDPARVIVEHASRCGTDLIMMPTRGYGPFRRFLTGSVTGKVLHDALCPVWTAAHVPEGRASSSKPYRKILCAVDRDDGAARLVKWAVWLARRYDATLKLVHVIPAVDETSKNRGEIELRRYLTTRARNQFAPLLKETDLPLELLLHGGNVAHALAETAKQESADLLVIGRGHLQKRLGRLRTQSLSIVCESPCPVVSF